MPRHIAARASRILDKSSNLQGQNYQVNQSLIAIGSGGLFGVGYGQSATKASYLPRDRRFHLAVIAEELGSSGPGSLLSSLPCSVSVCSGLRTRWGPVRAFAPHWLRHRDRPAGVHQHGLDLGVIPLTGVPLPFVSYGGTALAIFITMMGISLNISQYA